MSNSNERQTSARSEPFDIEAFDYPDEVVEVDPKADAFAPYRPVPDGRYLAQVKLNTCRDTPPVQKKKSKRGNSYTQVSIVAKILRPIDHGIGLEDVHGRFVFDELRTLTRRGRNSSVVDFILALGTTPKEIFAGKPTEIALRHLNKERELLITTEWQAWSKVQKKVVRYGMKNFPSVGVGRYNHVLKYYGETIVASATVTKYEAVRKASMNIRKEKS